MNKSVTVLGTHINLRLFIFFQLVIIVSNVKTKKNQEKYQFLSLNSWFLWFQLFWKISLIFVNFQFRFVILFNFLKNNYKIIKVNFPPKLFRIKYRNWQNMFFFIKTHLKKSRLGFHSGNNCGRSISKFKFDLLKRKFNICILKYQFTLTHILLMFWSHKRLNPLRSRSYHWLT